VTPAEDNRISIDEFMKVELRVAKVLEAEAVPEVKEAREIEGGLSEASNGRLSRHRRGVSAEQLVGRTIAIVLQPQARQIDGHRIERNGASPRALATESRFS
jgi:methionyl-tRNA synthetase